MSWWKRRSERLDAEILEHIQYETQENIDAGMTPREARYAALRKFGSVTQAKEASRELWGWLWLERLWQDLRYAVRGFGRSPGFTAVALLSLMLGIGASTALFSVVYGVLIAPYPYAKPNEIWAPAVVGLKESPDGLHSYPRREFLEIQKLPAFSAVMATGVEQALLSGGAYPEVFRGILLTGGAFNFIGVPPLLGRTIQPFDIQPGGQPETVVVLSYGFWLQRFNGEADAIGKKLVINDVPRTIIGVMPPRFGWYTSDSFWLPMPMNMADQAPIDVIMRLQSGVTPPAAEQQLQVLNQQLAADKPRNFPKTAFRTVLLNYMDITTASGDMATSLRLLFAAVGFLLLIACVNVANLQLARTTARVRDIAVRLSIGAGRQRLVWQLLTESVVLSLLGGFLGVLFAFGAIKVISALMPENYVPNEARITINGYVLLFSAAVSVLTGILFGLTPALRCSRPNLVETLKDGGRGAGGSARGQAIRSGLVVAEVALSVILLAGASLAIRSFANLIHIDPGFQPQHMLRVQVPLPPKRYTSLEQRNAFGRSLLESVSTLPGVESAAFGNGGMPFGGPPSSYSIEGQLPAEDKRVIVSLISSDYLRTLGTPLRRGRALTRAEVQNGEHFALINETAAKLWQAGVDPIGKRMSVDLLKTGAPPEVPVPAGSRPDVTVIGIIADTRNAGLRDITLPGVFVPYTLVAPAARTLAVRTFGEPMSVLNGVRQRVHALDKDVALGQSRTLEEVYGFETVQPRFNMALFSCFAALGLALAAGGIYSVISYDVTQRMHEIGVRMALGARRADVLSLVLRIVARVVALGLVIGLCGSALLERIVRFQVFAATPFDWTLVAGVVGVLSIIALLAALMPARRGARFDPITALRHEA
jgi:putative ABC transport system permease protein